MNIPYIIIKVFESITKDDRSTDASVDKRDQEVHITKPRDSLDVNQNLNAVVKEVIQPQIRDITLDLEDTLLLSDSEMRTYQTLISSDISVDDSLYKPIKIIRIIENILYSDSMFNPLVKSILDTLNLTHSIKRWRLRLINSILNTSDTMSDSTESLIYTTINDRIRLNDVITY